MFSALAVWGRGVNFELHPQRIKNAYGTSYSFYAELSTNDLAPDAPLGMYFIASPEQPTNGTYRQMELTTTGFSFVTGGSGGYSDFNAFMNGLTNGPWTLRVTNSTTTNVYQFTLDGSGMTSNMLPAVTITFPLDGVGNVTNHPNFTWEGPSSWPGTIVMYDYKWNQTTFSYDFFSYNFPQPPTSTTNWLLTDTAPPGANTFYVQYTNDATSVITCPTPMETNSATAFPGWAYRCQLDDSASVNFSVAGPTTFIFTGHTNIAYYSFEDNSQFAQDFSGHGNNISIYGGSPYMTNDAAAGTYALAPAGAGYLYAPTNLVEAFAGSFSVSLWLKTSDVYGSDSGDVYSAAGIVSAFSGPGDNVGMPMGLTGHKLAFYTGGDTDDTLHSLADVNTGDYVHVVVTRNQQTGEKKIYVNGMLDNADFGATNLLNESDEITIGQNNGATFNGELDEVQFYSGVLSASEVTQLYNNPGTTVPDAAGGNSSGLIAHYDFDEGTELAADVSGNGNDLVLAGDFGGSGPTTDADHIGSSGESVYFDGGSFISAPTSLLPTLAGSFTISFWVKTTQDNGDPDDLAWTGDAIISADMPTAGANDLIPAALTGGQMAFNTANTEFDYDDTINSSTYVSDGDWHHIVVSRNQPTGEKFIYIDGVLDVSDSDSTNLLNDPHLLTLGCKADASDSDPASPASTGENGYEGLLDDLQIYNRVLSSNEVAFLHDNPGATLAGNDFNVALNTTNLTWTTGGDANWFIETTNTFDGVSAAQSGVITDSQTNWIETTVTADGELSFYWKVSSEEDFDYLTFYINGEPQDSISGEVDWNQETYSVFAGDTLRWEYGKDDSVSEGANAGWLDQVVLPGATVAPPVDVEFELSIVRDQTYTSNDSYYCFPNLISVSGTQLTEHTVESPNNWFHTSTTNGSGSYIEPSLDAIINECTNGFWKLYINKGDPSQQLFTFKVMITDLDTNLLQAAVITTPANGSSGVATNTPFEWSGPTGFNGIFVYTYRLTPPNNTVSTNLPGTATNWPAPPLRDPGTNRLYISYHTNNVPFITTTIPVNGASTAIHGWSMAGHVNSDATSQFVVNSAATPVQLGNIQRVGNNIQFSFTTELGRTNIIEGRTNLVTGTWQPLTNFVGDGTSHQFSFPTTNPPIRFFRVNAQ